MKELLSILVAREEGYTRRQWRMGGAFVAAIIVACIMAEIINAL